MTPNKFKQVSTSIQVQLGISKFKKKNFEFKINLIW